MRCSQVPPLVATCILPIMLCATAVGAQVIEVPWFLAGQATFAQGLYNLGLATSPDGTIVVLWNELDYRANGDDFAVTRHFAADGTPLGAPVRIDTDGRARHAVIASDAIGGYVAAWGDDTHALAGRRLDAGGAGAGSVFEAGCAGGGAFSYSVAGLSSGSVYVYYDRALHGCVVDGFGQVRATIAIDPTGTTNAVAGLADGGFVVAVGGIAHIYDADGTPRGGAVALGATPGFYAFAVRGSPLGGFAVLGARFDASVTIETLLLREFDPAGTALGDEVEVVTADAGISIEADFALDGGGNALVAWTTRSDALLGTPQARGFDAAGGALGPAFEVNQSAALIVRVAALPTDAFVIGWENGGLAYGSVVSLCTPGVAVCGDGVAVAQCEQCDDGAANSDAAPDACRSDCRRAHCGDGVVDGGEECDDGNVRSCDGCSATCRSEPGFVCGDGIVEPGCGETCDDGNLVDGDGCDASCRRELIPGGGGVTTDCYTAWAVDNPTNAPFRDHRGAINADQRCVDDDPRCDFDGGVPGSCTFHVQLCANVTTLPRCSPEPRLATCTLVKPSEAQALRSPALAEVRATFAGAVPALIGPTTRDVCTDVMPIKVPLRGIPGAFRAGKVKLKSEARPYGNAADKDNVKLTCLPGG